MRMVGAKRLLSVAGVLLGFAVAELTLRVAGIAPPEVRSYDPVRGWQLKPGAKGLQRSEGHAQITINSGGFRGPEVTAAKALGIVRVAVVGDSFTEAMHVPYPQTFCAVMERELAQCKPGGLRSQVLDFGVSGYGTAQELLTLREQVWPYTPDLVILAFFPGNDVSDNSSALDSESWISGEKCRPHFSIRNGEPVEEEEFRTLPLANLWCHSVFWLNRFAIMDYLGEPAVLLQRTATTPRHAREVEGSETGLNDEIYGPPPTSRWSEAWAVTEKLIVEMSQEAKAHSARFAVVTLSTPIQVYPDAAYRSSYLRKIGGAELFYADHRLEALGAREGFAVLNLAPSLQAYADQHHAFLHGFANTRLGSGHWNELGHRLAGELIAKRFCDLIGQNSPSTTPAR